MTPKLVSGAGWEQPTPIDIDHFHNNAVDYAVKLFYEAKGEALITGHFVLAGMGQTAVFYCPWENDDEKYETAYKLRQICQHMEIEAYSFITEAWAVAIAPDEAADLDAVPKPHDHPNREDVYNIWTSTRTGHHKATRFGVKYYHQDPLKLALGIEKFKPPRLLERDDGFSGMGGAATQMVGQMFNFFETYEESQRRIDEAYERGRKAGRRGPKK